jgi:hypothetical protein
MQFFFPKTSALIDWGRSHEFLDKEFMQKIPVKIGFLNNKSGRNQWDLIAPTQLNKRQ